MIRQLKDLAEKNFSKLAIAAPITSGVLALLCIILSRFSIFTIVSNAISAILGVAVCFAFAYFAPRFIPNKQFVAGLYIFFTACLTLHLITNVLGIIFSLNVRYVAISAPIAILIFIAAFKDISV